jgi:plastocyanin domain-containing protein
MKQLKLLFSTALIFLLFYALNVNAEKKVYTATVDSDGIQRVEIVGGEYYFDPEQIIVKVNVPVELTYRKTPGITPHNIIINAPDAGISVNENMSKDPKTIMFTPTKTGKYEISCDKKLLFFKSHKERGMEGILEVVE